MPDGADEASEPHLSVRDVPRLVERRSEAIRVKVLCIAAHPDDEVLGCGATMAKRAKAGDEVRILILADGVTSREYATALHRDDALTDRLLAVASAARALGVGPARVEGQPDNQLDTVPLLALVRLVEAALAAHAPAVVYTHHPECLNIDHALTARAVLTATRPRPGQPVREVLAFEVPSSTEWHFGRPAFAPTVFEDVTDTLDAKLRALDGYAQELRAFPHPRSPEAVTALARWRGATAGVPAAEAFVLLRGIR